MTAANLPAKPSQEPGRKTLLDPIDLRMSARQLVSTVRNGRQVHVSILDESGVNGYLAGMDDEMLFLLGWRDDVEPSDASFAKILVPRKNILLIELFDERTFREEGQYEDMEQIVRPFRKKINETYFADRSYGVR